jgi:hypothetical protein
MNSQIQFYTTAGCHLCEEAYAMLQHVEQHKEEYAFDSFSMSSVDLIDIVDDEKLVEHYGIRIPVLKNEKGQELAWPFEFSELLAWLKPL